MPKNIENSNKFSFETQVTFNDLPNEIIVKIFEHLSAKDLGKMRELSGSLRMVAEDEKLWKIQFAKLGIDDTEMDLIENNGGYKNAYYKMRELINNKFDLSLYEEKNDCSDINALLFIISRTTIFQFTRKFTFFSSQSLNDDLLTIAKCNKLALNFLLKRPSLLDYFFLAKLAAHTIDYATTILEDFSQVVIEVLNAQNGEPLTWNLPYFFTQIEENAGFTDEYRQFIENFNSSEKCLQLYLTNNLSFDFVVS